MPLIKPFCALKANPSLLNDVVTRSVENYEHKEARLKVSQNKFSFLHLTHPELENPELRKSNPELIYKIIRDKLERFIKDKVLITEEKASIYIYQVKNTDTTQTGIWALTDINEYLEGNIKKHEQTIAIREKLLADYLIGTGLDANPVLITYKANDVIKSIITKYSVKQPIINLTCTEGSQHKIWAINDAEDLEKLIKAFANIKTVYIADGHHRIASMAKMSLSRKVAGDSRILPSDFFTSVYLDHKQLKISAYNRVVSDLGDLTEAFFLKCIESNFFMQRTDKMVKPIEPHHFAMYLKSDWYKLIAKPHTYNDSPLGALDVKILQDYILAPILKIEKARPDGRIRFVSEKTEIKQIQDRIDNGLDAVAFILNAISINQLTAVADAGEVMPPKSTWIEPKFLIGLLTYQSGK